VKSYKIKNLMVSVTDYATVSEDATLYEAVKALEATQKNFDQDRYKHRGVLVYDKNNKIIGKLGQPDVLKALEPKYDEMQDRQGMKGLDFSPCIVIGVGYLDSCRWRRRFTRKKY
jgi:CBS-domain-containing membrane protein